MHGKIFLIVFDNLEEVILNDLQELRVVLARLDEECQHLKVIMTTYRSFGCIDN